MVVGWAKRGVAGAVVAAGAALIAGACLPPELTFDANGGGGTGGGTTCPQCGECEECSTGTCLPAAAGAGCDGGRCDGAGFCASGQKVWTRRFGGPDNQYVESVAIRDDDTIVLGGLMRGTVTFEQGAPIASTGGKDAFLAALDGDNSTLWSDGYGDAGEQQINAVCVAGDTTHAAGSFNGGIPPREATGSTDAFWLRRYWTGVTNVVGIGSAIDADVQHGLAIAKPDLGGIVWVGGSFTGMIEAHTNLSAMAEDGFLVAFDEDGEGAISGGRHIRGTGIESVQALASIPGGSEFVAVGDFSENVDEDVCDLASDGDCVGGFYVLPSNCEGKQVVCSSSGGEAHALSVAVANDGTIWVTGWFRGELQVGGRSTLESANEDAFVLMLSPVGETEVFRHGGDENDRGHAIAVDANGNAVVAGQFRGDMSAGDFTLDGGDDDDAFVFKTAPGGEVLWAHAFAGPGRQSATTVAVGPDGSVVVAGVLDGSANFAGDDLESEDQEDIFVVKLSP